VAAGDLISPLHAFGPCSDAEPNGCHEESDVSELGDWEISRLNTNCKTMEPYEKRIRWLSRCASIAYLLVPVIYVLMLCSIIGYTEYDGMLTIVVVPIVILLLLFPSLGVSNSWIVIALVAFSLLMPYGQFRRVLIWLAFFGSIGILWSVISGHENDGFLLIAASQIAVVLCLVVSTEVNLLIKHIEMKQQEDFRRRVRGKTSPSMNATSALLRTGSDRNQNGMVST
jgi:hypothetical protein